MDQGPWTMDQGPRTKGPSHFAVGVRRDMPSFFLVSMICRVCVCFVVALVCFATDAAGQGMRPFSFVAIGDAGEPGGTVDDVARATDSYDARAMRDGFPVSTLLF